ncbi:hypothetical protein ERC79_09410 [Rhodococcus sp. ABRD24]|uniref:hypothetical protein n=1 Tax=Rhodococcus sp. ABRD24 TaxID=2507582 RepID=UPI00103D3FA1|nr:hypothetical protein [Rhodococcus sp. ABRD24]QBJ96166.1 hypothetical protein ERC79_09410 [Rhodococcus sp. ABRD24]
MRRGTERFRRTAMVGVMCAAALAMSACGDGGNQPSVPGPVTTTVMISTTPPIPAPTAAELNAILTKALDASLPAAEKVALVQGAAADPGLIDQVVAAAMANKVTVEVTEVTDLGDGAVAATVTMILDGQPNPDAIMNFVAEDGVWKLSQDNACGTSKLPA